jgi:hypothetical protein
VGSLLRVVGSRTQCPAQANPATTRFRLGAIQLFEPMRGVCFRYEFAPAVQGRGELAGVNALNADERALIPPRVTHIGISVKRAATDQVNLGGITLAVPGRLTERNDEDQVCASPAQPPRVPVAGSTNDAEYATHVPASTGGPQPCAAHCPVKFEEPYTTGHHVKLRISRTPPPEQPGQVRCPGRHAHNV